MKKIFMVVPLILLLTTFVCAQDYRTTSIRSLGGNAKGYSLSSTGQVLGDSEIDRLWGPDHTFIWNRLYGTFDVDALVGQHLEPCDNDACGEGTNSHQAIVGHYGPPGAFRAFIWYPPFTQIQDLGTLGGSTSVAIGVNEAGEVVGSADLPSGRGHAFLWSSLSGMQDLDGSLDHESYGRAINNLHQVAGVRDLLEVFLWTPDAGLQELGFQGRPYAINDNGEMVGRLFQSGHAFYWSKNTGLMDLGALPGDSHSEAVGINNHSQVVGTSSSQAECVPFIWTPMGGMKPLPPMKGRWVSAAINDAGQVLVNHLWGNGRAGTKLLTPVMHVVLTSSPNPSKVGELVTFTVTASSVQGPPRDGTLINIKVDKKLHQMALVVGQAVFATANLPQGTHTSYARYSGDDNYYASTSNVVQQIVNP